MSIQPQNIREHYIFVKNDFRLKFSPEKIFAQNKQISFKYFNTAACSVKSKNDTAEIKHKILSFRK